MKMILISLGIWIFILLFNSTFSSVVPAKTEEELGRALFFDPILSIDSTISCASCHKPELAFADSVSVSSGIRGKKGLRNTPSLLNAYLRSVLFYDGRSHDLVDQVRFPVENQDEMAFSMEGVVNRLYCNDYYRAWFQKLYVSGVNHENITRAIAAYERTLINMPSPFDRFQDGEASAISASAIRGRKVFMSEKGKCFNCHFTVEFTGDQFVNIGLYDGEAYKDAGRFMVTKDLADLGRFRVPSLRNVAVTPPYMHDGSIKTLRNVIEYYDNPSKFVKVPVNADSIVLNPIGFTDQEKNDLEEFLKSLTDLRYSALITFYYK